MNTVLKTIGYLENLSFENIFSKKFCQKLVKYYWDIKEGIKEFDAFKLSTHKLGM